MYFIQNNSEQIKLKFQLIEIIFSIKKNEKEKYPFQSSRNSETVKVSLLTRIQLHFVYPLQPLNNHFQTNHIFHS